MVVDPTVDSKVESPLVMVETTASVEIGVDERTATPPAP